MAAAPVAGANNAAARSIATNRAVKSGAPEVHFVPEDKTVAAKDGLSLLEIAESNGMTIESGCRMGICGADPVAIKDGMECLSGISDESMTALVLTCDMGRRREWHARRRELSPVAATEDRS